MTHTTKIGPQTVCGVRRHAGVSHIGAGGGRAGAGRPAAGDIVSRAGKERAPQCSRAMVGSTDGHRLAKGSPRWDAPAASLNPLTILRLPHAPPYPFPGERSQQGLGSGRGRLETDTLARFFSLFRDAFLFIKCCPPRLPFGSRSTAGARHAQHPPAMGSVCRMLGGRGQFGV